MCNLYLVKTVGDEKVVGLAVGEGDKYIATCYATSGKEGSTAPTTIADLKAGVDSGAIPVPPTGLLSQIGLDSYTIVAWFADTIGDAVYLEHAMVA